MLRARVTARPSPLLATPGPGRERTGRRPVGLPAARTSIPVSLAEDAERAQRRDQQRGRLAQEADRAVRVVAAEAQRTGDAGARQRREDAAQDYRRSDRHASSR